MNVRYCLLCLTLLLTVFACTPLLAQEHSGILKGKTICVDPGHGGTAGIDSYRVGPSGEREEWINLRVGLALKQLLEKRGAEVIMTREKDTNISLKERVQIAVRNQADLFISIHHNATADSSVNFPIVYFHGNASENKAGVRLGKLMIKSLSKELYANRTPASLVSDLVIFPGSGTAVLRGTYGIPGVLVEASFFTNPAEEERLKKSSYNLREAKAYLEAMLSFFSMPVPSVEEVHSKVHVEPFQVLQEEERMKAVARKWKSDFIKGYHLYNKGDSAALEKALELFTRSARSFPDSWLSRAAHTYRAKIFGKTGRAEKKKAAKTRVAEFYIPLQRNTVFLEKMLDGDPDR